MKQEDRGIATAFAIVVVLALVALAFVFNPTPWSPMGRAQQEQGAEKTPGEVDLSEFDIPDGWEPGDDGTRIIIPRAPATQT